MGIAILEGQGGMVTVNAHFDGRVIVPDEPLDYLSTKP